jgi:hypothetical protein
MTFNNTDPSSNGISVVSNSQIKFDYAGVYDIQFSAQVDRTSGGSVDTVDIWLSKNGTNVPDTNGTVTISGSAADAKIIAAWNYVVNVAVNDYFELYWQASDTDIILHHETSKTLPTRPAIPSVILTATQVMYTQVGPTGPAGPTGPTGPPGSTTLDGLTDVTITSPITGQALVYNAGISQWVNTTASTDPMNDSKFTAIITTDVGV